MPHTGKRRFGERVLGSVPNGLSIKRRTLINNGRPKSGPKSIQEKILEALCENELSSAKLVAAIGQHTLSGKLKLAIKAMLANGLIEYTIPNKPRSRLQKYRLTEKGRSVLGKPQK